MRPSIRPTPAQTFEQARPSHRTCGFTLLELSIVLTVIGLIVGGIVAGKSLIRNAEIHSVLSDFGRFKSAIANFKLKYNALPGDFSQATAVWGSAGGTGSATDNTCYLAQTAASLNTCNGDNSGTIGAGIINNQAGYQEGYTGWKQLANAGLLNFALSGHTGASDRYSQPGVNVPSGKIAGTGYTMFYAGLLTLGAGNFFGSTTMQTVFVYGSPDTTYNAYETYAPALTVAESQSLDAKVDDGLPGTGFYQSYNTSTYSCATSSDPTTALYNLSATGVLCSIIYNTGI